MFDFDDELARRYGAFASYPSEVSPSLVEYYGENPTGEIDRLMCATIRPQREFASCVNARSSFFGVQS